MAGEFRRTDYATAVTYLDTGLNSLADGAGVLGGNVDLTGAAGGQYFADFELFLNTVTPGNGPYVQLYRVGSLDGTNFEDGDASTFPPAGAFYFERGVKSGNNSKRVLFYDFPLMPGLQKFLIVNRIGAAWNATLNTLKYRIHTGRYTS